MAHNTPFRRELSPITSEDRSMAYQAITKRNEAIRRERYAGATVEQLMQKYGVGRTTVEKLRCGG